jgi:preprotein translocase subunit SecF
MDTLGYKSAIIQSAGSEGTGYIIRTPVLDETTKNNLVNGLSSALTSLTVNEFDNISPQIASETTRNAGIAVVVAVLAMLLYIAFAFRKMPNPFKFGVCAVIGLAFDLLVTLGIFSILGAIRNWEIDLMFVTGVLAVLGYSINNTVIVFDRIRENTARGISQDIEVVANASIIETLNRSFNSSLTTLITLFVLALFVGATIQNFVSPELLVAWQKKEWGSFSSKESNLVTARVKS